MQRPNVQYYMAGDDLNAHLIPLSELLLVSDGVKGLLALSIDFLHLDKAESK